MGLMIDIRQQMLIANGYPKNAIIKPIIKIIDGMSSAFFSAKGSDRYSWLGLMSINDFAIQNSMMLIRIKSKPYSTSATNENGLLATNVVRYGINEIISSNNTFCQIIFALIFSTWLYITWGYCQILVQTKNLSDKQNMRF